MEGDFGEVKGRVFMSVEVKGSIGTWGNKGGCVG